MTIKELKKFGPFRRSFSGAGVIRFITGNEMRAKITLAQRSDTQLIVYIDGVLPGFGIFDRKHKLESFQGELKNGLKIYVIAPIFIKESKTSINTGRTRIIGYPTSWSIGEKNFDFPTTITFEIVNFRFLGTEGETYSREGYEYSTLSLMPLNIGGREVLLRWIPEYDQAITILNAQRGVQVTCKATMPINSPSDIDDCISVMDTLCDVMSIARATLVSWTSFEVGESNNDRSIHTLYRNSVTRRYSGTELVDYRDSKNTKYFLEKGFLRCSELDDNFQTRRVARAYTETRDGPFIESRGLLIAVLTEYLANTNSRFKNKASFIEDEVFTARWDSIKINLKDSLRQTFPDINKRYISVMLNSAKNMNRRPLSWKLNNLAKWLDLKFEPGEVEEFVKTRNSLAHEGIFPSNGSSIAHYQRMQHFLDRIVLKLFGYTGPYIDFEQMSIRQL